MDTSICFITTKEDSLIIALIILSLFCWSISRFGKLRLRVESFFEVVDRVDDVLFSCSIYILEIDVDYQDTFHYRDLTKLLVDL